MYYPFLSAQAALEQLRVRIVLQRHSVGLLRIRGRKSVESLGSLKSGVSLLMLGAGLLDLILHNGCHRRKLGHCPGGDSRRMLLTRCSLELAAKHLYY